MMQAISSDISADLTYIKYSYIAITIINMYN